MPTEQDVRERPSAAVGAADEPVGAFVAELQAAIERSDADLFNRSFTADVLWGSPFGAVVGGYDEIHHIHSSMFAAAARRQRSGAASGSRYQIDRASLVADDVAVAFVRRLADRGDATAEGPRTPGPGRAEAFDELALFVLVRRDGSWWLAAGLHTPDRRDVYSSPTEGPTTQPAA